MKDMEMGYDEARLEVQVIEVFKVKLSLLVGYIKKVYGVKITPAAVRDHYEWNDESTPVFEVVKRPLSPAETRDLKAYIERCILPFTLDILLDDLCNKGALLPGTYYVLVEG